jgi:hypothetical protein
MELLDEVSDRCIRRALGFAGLGIGLVLLALSFDLALAFRSAGDLVALVAAAMLLLAWRAPRRDMRHSEAWTMLRDLAPEWTARRSRQELQERMREAWRRRLLWHTERIAVLALLFWAVGLGIGLIRDA